MSPPVTEQAKVKDILASIQSLNAEEVAVWITEREERIMANANEGHRRSIERLNRKIADANKKVEEAIPITDAYEAIGLRLIKPHWCTGDTMFAFAKSVELKVTHYLLGPQAYPLPEQYRVNGYTCYLVFYFNANRELTNLGMLNRNLKNIEMFHAKGQHICLGDSSSEIFKLVDFCDPQTMLDASNKILDILTTVNPYSYLSHPNRLWPRGFDRTYKYVQSEIDKFRNTYCDQCGKEREACDCEKCGECSQPFDNCQCSFCERCDNNIDADNCYCWYCEDCDERFPVGDSCNCDICGQCERRVKTEYGDQCECPRCESCSRVEEDCDCEDGFKEPQNGGTGQ